MKFFAALVLVGVTLSTGAYAQTDGERAAARSTARSGIEAFQDGRYEEAVELLSRAESVVHAPTHLLFTARAQLKLGHLVEAKEAYLKVINERLAKNAPDAFFRAQEDAQTELEAFEANIPKLKINVSGADRSAVQVTINGEPLPNIALGVATPINPGTHRVVVSSEGKTSQESTITVSEAENKSIDIVLLDGPSDSGPGSSGDALAEPKKSDSDTASQGSSRKYWGYGLGGVGIVSLGAGGALGFMTLAAAKKAEDDETLCPDKQCTPDGDEFVKSAKMKGTIANIALGAGAVLLGVGAYLVITAPGESEEVARIEPLVGPGSAGLSFSGAF